MPKFLPSGDQWRSTICSELKLVIFRPGELSRGCSQMLSTPFFDGVGQRFSVGSELETAAGDPRFNLKQEWRHRRVQIDDCDFVLGFHDLRIQRVYGKPLFPAMDRPPEVSQTVEISGRR